MNKKQTEALIEIFEKHYKYYKGWVFQYDHPGFFVYHQMGGQMSVAFTPEHDQDNTVSLQVHDGEGQVIDAESVPFNPIRHDIFSTKIDPFTLFTFVRPLLEKHGEW